MGLPAIVNGINNGITNGTGTGDRGMRGILSYLTVPIRDGPILAVHGPHMSFTPHLPTVDILSTRMVHLTLGYEHRRRARINTRTSWTVKYKLLLSVALVPAKPARAFCPTFSEKTVPTQMENSSWSSTKWDSGEAQLVGGSGSIAGPWSGVANETEIIMEQTQKGGQRNEWLS
ncbi:hypothetical protein DFH06DRAFT_1310841 [Mycena polygramma]|nr:hypothetical protein DFH06DRAFT_1310841 [Mycena polygramma]